MTQLLLTWVPNILCGVVQFSSVQSLSRVWLFVTPWIAARQASLSITNSWSLPKLMCIESVRPSSYLILCRPLLLLPPIPPSIRVFSSESALRMRWPKYWSFSFSISPANEHPGLISFRMDWLDLLAVQGTLKKESSPTPQGVKFSFLLYIFISFDKCIQLFKHHQHQDTEEFHHSKAFSHAAFHSQFLWESPAPWQTLICSLSLYYCLCQMLYK